jgi:hypothetical protein
MKMMKFYYPRPVEVTEPPKPKKKIRKAEVQELADSRNKDHASGGKEKSPQRERKQGPPAKGIDFLAGFLLTAISIFLG